MATRRCLATGAIVLLLLGGAAPVTRTGSTARAADVGWNTRTGEGAPYFEWRSSTVAGAFEGIVITVHSGGWRSSPSKVRTMDEEVARFRNAGYSTLNITYADNDGPRAVQDVIGFFEWMRHAFPDKQVCLVGSSAGGHLALMAAVLTPEITCVVSQAGPTDLNKLAAPVLRDAITSAFGTDAGTLAGFSPLNFSDSLRGRIMLGHAHNDLIVTYDHASDLASATGAVLNQMWPVGTGTTRYWIHSSVQKADVDRHLAGAVRFVSDRMAA